MSSDAFDGFSLKNFGFFKGKRMLFEMWMIKQFQVTMTDGAKCNLKRKNENEKSYYSSVGCCSKHVCYLIAPQILKLPSDFWIFPDKNKFLY